jgi:uncharacterized oligopeptide transporter (OPT) family protein
MNLLGAILIVMFGFLFVTVSSRLTGEIGSSSNPISGMTVATLLLTCLIFLLMGWIGPEHRLAALSIAAIVCVAASNGGTTSQDLKTGYLVGGTPRLQQIGILIGALSSALVIGYSLKALNDANTIYSKKAVPAGARVENVASLKDTEVAPDGKTYHVLKLTEISSVPSLSKLETGKYLVDNDGTVAYLVDPGVNGTLKHHDDGTSATKFDVPKARLMSLIIDGILTQKLPWGLVLLGVAISFVLELCGISALPFAVGVYLPLSASSPIFFGGLVRWLVEKYQSMKGIELTEAEKESSPGVLYSSGLIAGGTIGGTILAFLTFAPKLINAIDLGSANEYLTNSDLLPMIAFTIMSVILFFVGIARPKKAR